jgi:diguanylate cyclase (GGDEF)-like protein
MCVFFVHDHLTGDLEARHVIGDGTALVRGLRMGLGQRLSGWVAANRQTILNSDATLDLGEIAGSSLLSVRSCLSTPLVWKNELVGVLSLYSTEVSGFNDDHARIIEIVASQISHTLYRAIEFDNSPRRDTLTGLPEFEQLEDIIQSTGNYSTANTRHALLLIRVDDLTQINRDHGRAVGDEVLRHVARSARGGLRVADILFRNTGDDFVAFLGAADPDTAEVVATRIRERIRENTVVLAAERRVAVRVTVTTIISPPQGAHFRELLATAKTAPQPRSTRPHDESMIH